MHKSVVLLIALIITICGCSKKQEAPAPDMRQPGGEKIYTDEDPAADTEK